MLCKVWWVISSTWPRENFARFNSFGQLSKSLSICTTFWSVCGFLFFIVFIFLSYLLEYNFLHLCSSSSGKHFFRVWEDMYTGMSADLSGDKHGPNSDTWSHLKKKKEREREPKWDQFNRELPFLEVIWVFCLVCRWFVFTPSTFSNYTTSVNTG